MRPCTRTTWSKEPETTCEPSREKRTHLVRVGARVRARVRVESTRAVSAASCAENCSDADGCRMLPRLQP